MKVKYMMDGEKEKLKREKYNNLYMDLATRIADMSYAKRLHVGAVIVKESNIISFGWNGMPSGWDNNCEDKFYCDDGDWSEQLLPKEANQWMNYKLVSKPEVLHAEQNAITKMAKSTESGDGAKLFVTHAPCLDCAKLVYQSGISSVYYRNSYRSDEGIAFLKKCNVEVNKI
jgi:dCMP deaminase